MRSNQRYPRDAQQFSNERENQSNNVRSPPSRQTQARNIREERDLNDRPSPQAQDLRTRNTYQEPDNYQQRSYPNQGQSSHPVNNNNLTPYNRLVSNGNRSPNPNTGQISTGRRGKLPNEDSTTQKRSLRSLNKNDDAKKKPSKSVYDGRGYNQTPNYGKRAQSQAPDIDRESVASFIHEDLQIPGNKGSFSDKQTTNYDLQSKANTRTNRSGKKKKSAHASNKKPLPKVEDIMVNSTRSKAPKLEMKDAGEYFDDPKEKEAIMKAVQGIFRVNKSQEQEQKLFGIPMQEWDTCRVNPRVIAKLNQEDSDSDENDAQIKKKKKDQAEKAKLSYDNPNIDKPWWDAIIIGHRNPIYMVFNIFICALCLISSYFYASFVGFRYTFDDKDTQILKDVFMVFESIFLFDFLLQFIREYKKEGFPPVRDIGKIATHYVCEGTFALDLICLIPLGLSSMKRKRELLFFLVKMLRLIKGFSLFNVQIVMDFVKTIQYEKTQRIVDHYPDLANDTVSDHNNVEGLLMISYTLKILKLGIVIGNISYLTGVGWLVLCEAIRDFLLDIDIGPDEVDQNPDAEKYPEGFLVNYAILENTREQNQIIAIYFAFTSLSTVGFGDYAPRGNIERFVGAFILLFGVSIFSYIMGNFIGILTEFQAFHEPLDEGDQLSKFFGVIQEFNGQKPMKTELKKEIEDHFQYRWEKDKLAAFRAGADAAIFEQLPIDTQIMMYKEFLFKDFLDTYKRTFCFRDYECPDQPAFYTWDNPHYRNFMFDLLKCLEPRILARNEVVFNELDEVNEVIFIMSGAVDIGYEINRDVNYVLRIDKDILVGAYNVAYNKRSKFNYKAQKNCTGFSIRRIDWKKFMYQPDNKTVAGHLRKQIKKDYEVSIMSKVRMEKARAMRKWDKRADYDAILMVVETWKKGTAAAQQDSSSDDLADGIEHGSSEMVSRLLRRFDHYERETRNILQCYDELEDDYDFLQEKQEQTQRENENLKYQIQRMQADKSSKDYSKVQRVVPVNQTTKAVSQVVGLNQSPQNRPRSGIKQLQEEPGMVKSKTLYVPNPNTLQSPLLIQDGEDLQNMPQIPKQRPSANKFSRHADREVSPDMRSPNSPSRLRDGGSQKLEAPAGSLKVLSKVQSTGSPDKTGFKNSSQVNNRFNRN